MGEETVVIDYNAPASPEQIQKIEQEANRYISEDHPVCITFPTPEELGRTEYRSKKELEGEVRLVSFPGADTCACCGTHLSSSAQALMVKVTAMKKFHDGIRLELLCGNRAVSHMMECWQQNSAVSRDLSAPLAGTHAAVERLMEQNRNLREHAAELENDVFALIAEKYSGAGDTCVIRGAMEPDSVRRLCETVSGSCGGICAVFSGEGDSYRYALKAPDSALKELCSSINSYMNGRGGGRDGLAQGSVKCSADRISECFSEIVSKQ